MNIIISSRIVQPQCKQNHCNKQKESFLTKTKKHTNKQKKKDSRFMSVKTTFTAGTI